MIWRYNLPKCPVSREDRDEFMKIIEPIESVGMRGANKQAHQEHTSMFATELPGTDAERLADAPLTLAICGTTQVASGCKGPCDFSGWIDLVEPTTGRVTGGTACCKTCGAFAIDHSLRYGA